MANGVAKGVGRVAGSGKSYELDEQTKFSFSKTKACVLKSQKLRGSPRVKSAVMTRSPSSAARSPSVAPALSFDMDRRGAWSQLAISEEKRLPLSLDMRAFQSSLL